MKNLSKAIATVAFLFVAFIGMSQDAKAIFGVKGHAKMTLLLTHTGISQWPYCRNPKGNCTVELDITIGTIATDTEGPFVPLKFNESTYDLQSDGIVDETVSAEEAGTSIDLGDFILSDEMTGGQGELHVIVDNQPMDSEGVFKAYIVE